MRTTATFYRTILCTALLVSAATLALAGQPPAPPAAPRPVAPATFAVDMEQAKSTALSQSGTDEVLIAELEYKRDGRPVYTILTADDTYRVRVEIDASTGVVMKLDRKPLDHPLPGKWRDYPTSQAPISPDQAQEIALSATGGGTIVDFELDRKKHGRIIYEVEIIDENSKYEVEIDGRTGTIVEYKEKRPKHLRKHW